MADLSPKDMDKLFQKGSEQYDFEYNEAAWKQMEDLLERKDRRRRFIWWFFGVAMILVVSGGISFLWNLTPKPQTTNQSIDTTNVEISSEITIDKNQPATNGVSKSNIEKETKTEVVQSKNLSNKQTRSSEKSLQKETLDKTAYFSKNKIQEKLNPRKKEDRLVVKNISAKEKLAGNEPITQDKILLNPVKQSEKDLNYELERNKGKEDSNLQTGHSQLLFPPLPSQLFYIEQPYSPIAFDYSLLKEVAIVNRENTFSKQKNHLVIGALLAGELASVGINDFSETGWKIGGNIEYRYGQKYGFGLGANFIKKNYRAGEGAYIPPKGFWTRKIAPQSSEGHCNILEVPVTLNYFFKGYAKKGWYANVGISSYFMLRERYNYFYELPDSDLIRKWGTKNTNHHWFGIGQIALGYHLPFENRTALQIASYLQLPLQGLGHGQVKLYSIGLQVKYNYQFLR